MVQRTDVAVVGAGVGGLAAAARLAHAGYTVDLYEKAAGPGGRCSRLTLNGFTFDTGPTLLLMPEVLEETFRAVGRELSDHLQLVRCDPNYRIHFRDGPPLTLSSELTHMRHELEEAEPGSFKRYLEFLSRGETQYRTSLDHFVSRNFETPLEMLGPRTLRKLLAVRAHRGMYADVARVFRNERIRRALTFQTMYLGISPYESPAVYGLLPYTELAHGIWFPMGGMYQLPLALERLCIELGVRLHYGAPVARIDVEGGRAAGLTLKSGDTVAADIVLCNADLPWAYKHLIPASATRLPRAERLRYTSSAFMLYLGVNKRLPGLLHHNVIFGSGYREVFEDLFRNFRVPEDPSFYVNVPNRTDGALAPRGGDALYVLVPVPHRHPSIDWSVEGPRLRTRVLDRLEVLGNFGLRDSIVAERVFTPDDYAMVLNLERGSAFGLSHNFCQVGPFRPANQDPRVKNLFFVGASTQPGTGLPMVLLSARLAVERIRASCGPGPSDPAAAPAREVAA